MSLPDIVGMPVQIPWEVPDAPLAEAIPVLVVFGMLLGYVTYRVVYVVEHALASSTQAVGAAITNSHVFAAVPTQRIVTARYRPRNEILNATLAVLTVAVGGGTVLALSIGRTRYFGMAVIGLLTVGLVDLLVFRRLVGSEESLLVRTELLWVVLRDRRFAVSALLSSVIVLATLGRGLAYFLCVSVFVGSLVVNVYLTDERYAPILSSLALLVVAAGTVLAAQVLTGPYYVETLDTVYHTALARRIADAGSLVPTIGTRYTNLPVFHTLSSVFVQLSPVAPRTVIGVLVAVLFSVVVVAAYAIVRNVTGSRKIGFYAAAFAAVNPEFIRWGVQAHVQSLSFFFLAVFLLLLSKLARDIRYTVVSVFIVVAWTITHHLSVFMSVVLIAVWTIAGTAWILAARHADGDSIQRPLHQYMILTVSVAVYWWLTDLVQVPIRWITQTSPSASSGLPTEQFVIQTYTDPVELMLASVPFLLDNVHYALFLGVGGYGLWTIVRPNGTMPSRVFPKVIAGFLVAVPLYIPNPTWALARGLAALNRWGIMTLLFLLPVVALGLARVDDHRRTAGIVAVSLLVVTAAFVSVGGGFTDPSLSNSFGYDKGARDHFTTGDLAAADYVLEHTSDTPVYASHSFSGYLIHEDWTGPTAKRSSRFGRMRITDGSLEAQPGLTVVEQTSLREGRIKVLVRPPGSAAYNGEETIRVLDPVSADGIDLNPDGRNVVYDNTDTFVMYEPDRPDAADNETT